MHRQVAIPRVKPRWLAELSHGLQAEKSVALHAPSALAAQHAGEHVSDRIDVGGNVESPPQQVIASIDDDGDVLGGHGLAQAVDKLCAAGAAGEHADHLFRSIMRPSFLPTQSHPWRRATFLRAARAWRSRRK